ncbi:TPA: hypothetical protein QDB06_000769 [Burkholderia vietnamiensis]|nr:hypothetical protein [Burkholderia vietnamiensis]
MTKENNEGLLKNKQFLLYFAGKEQILRAIRIITTERSVKVQTWMHEALLEKIQKEDPKVYEELMKDLKIEQ